VTKLAFTMQEHSAKASAHIELVPATAGQEPILANLLELYTYDFSEFHDLDLGEVARFAVMRDGLADHRPESYVDES